MADTPAGLLQREREQARALLADGYANDWIDQGQLEARLEAVEQARTVGELHALTAELKLLAAGPEVTQAMVPAKPRAPAQKLGVLLGTLARAGTWIVAARTQVRVVLGSAVLDLRTATLPVDGLELEVHVTLGSLDVIVPPGWKIDNRCGAILASVDHDDSHVPARASQTLRLFGRVVLGSLMVHERLPGESHGDARRRRKRERKALAEARTKGLPPGRG